MGIRLICVAAIAAFALCVSGRGANPDLPVAISAKQLTGEWASLTTRNKPNDTLVVITYRPNGICRYDAIDLATLKMPVGPDVHLPGVGTWKIEGRNLVVAWEKWSPAQHKPIQSAVALQVDSLDEIELVTKMLEPIVADKPERFTRFPGWWSLDAARAILPR